MPNRLLLADEDPKTLRVLEVSLRGAGFDVTSVTTGAAAWVAIDQELPQVILAATNLAALDGFELCARVRAREGGRDVAFLLLGDDDSLALRVKSIEAGADDYLLKPPSIQEVVARVRSLVQRRDREKFASSARAAEAFAGQLADLSVVDLLQVVADSRRSGIVHLRGAREAPATIYFRQGQVVDAEVGRLSGVNAISRLFSWTEGSFEVHWKPIRRPNAINLSTPELILEGMKRLDERNRLAGGLPDLNGVFEVNYRVLAERLSEIPDEVNAVLRLFDGSRTLAHVVEDCQLPDPEAMAIAIRLRDEGIIHNVSQPGERSGGLVVPPRPAGRAPGADDVTVVRRITSVGTGSGPVQQSLGPETEGYPAVSAASAETVVGPLPVGPSSFDDVDGVISPANHAKTDPGLGQPLALPEGERSGRATEDPSIESGAVPAARAPVTDAEVTAPHDADEALFPPEVAPPGSATESFDAPPPDEPGAAASALDADPSSLQTQRGLGPFPQLFEERAPPTTAADVAPDFPAAEVPRPLEVEDADRPDGNASFASGVDGMVDAAPIDAQPIRSQGGSGGAKTIPVDLAEEELSAKEAMEELGVPGPKRGLGIVAVLAIAGALAAVAVHKLRSAPSPAPAASAPVAGAPPNTGAPSAAPATAENRPPAPPPPANPAEGAPAAAPPAEQAVAAKAEPAKDQPTTVEAAQVGTAKPAGSAEKPPAPTGAAPTPQGATTPQTAAPAEAPAPPAKSAAAAVPTKTAPAADFARQLATCRSQFLRDRIRDAATTCAAALEANPSSADALTMMAHVELNRGHLARANDLAQKSIAIDPNQADAYVIIGGVHQDSGRNAQAKSSYRRYLQLAPHGRYAAEVRSIVGSL